MAGPLVRLYLRRRTARGKEDPSRLPERRGIASAPFAKAKIRSDNQMRQPKTFDQIFKDKFLSRFLSQRPIEAHGKQDIDAQGLKQTGLGMQ